MKKLVLLVILPLALSLSSCGNKPQKNINNNDSMIEDTLMHEEIFGALPSNTQKWDLNPKKSLGLGIDLYKPMIGFQRKDNNDGTYSVRFVAAMQLETDNASWFRSVHNLAGTVEKSKLEVPVQTVYSALNNAGNIAYASDVEAEDGTNPYDCYAVYCLLNIPNSYSDYYVDAYITVNDGGNHTTSDVGSLNVADGNKAYKYQLSGSNRDTAFINGVERVPDSGSNKVDLYSVDLNVDDKVEIYYVNEATLTYSKNTSLTLGAAFPDFVLDTDKDILTTKYSGTYNVYLNNENQFFFTKKISFQGPTGWGTDKTAKIQLKSNDGSSHPEETMLSTETAGLFYYFVDTSAYKDAQFFQQQGDTKSDWTDYRGNSLKTGKNIFTLPSWDNVGTSGSWETNVHVVPVADNSNFTITEKTKAVEIHTALQKQYLAYTGDYSLMDPEDYPDGNALLSDPEPVTITWNYTVPDGKTLDHYSLVFGQYADLSDGYEVVGTTTKSISFYNAFLGKNYFKLKAYFTEGEPEQSAIHSFIVDGTAPRNIKIDGLTNCRDIGGRYTEDGGRIKQGLIYRTSGENFLNSGSNDNITEAGRAEMLNHLRVRTEINVSNNTSNVVNLTGTTVRNLYMDYDTNGLNSSHHLSRNTESLKNFVEAAADSNNYPIFFHCRIGTDRTGLCAITLAGLLGVPLNEIYQDYLFSNFGNIDGKRYIGDLAGQDNIQNYMSEINQMAGTTFKNKMYNMLLSIGVSASTLDTLIANLTENTLAKKDGSIKEVAPANLLTGNNVNVIEDYSERNHPNYYFTLDGSDKYVSYTFNAPSAYSGQLVAYLGNTNHSSSMFMDETLRLSLDDREISVRSVDYSSAGMGNCSSRMNYFPVILASDVAISAGDHRIVLAGLDGHTMNVGGIYIYDASKNATNVGGGVDSGELHYHDFESRIITPATCADAGEIEYTCTICGDVERQPIPALPHSYEEEITEQPTCTSTGVKTYTCTVCDYSRTEPIPKVAHSWVSTGEPVTAIDGSTRYETFACSVCGAKKVEIAATSGVFADGSSIKSGTPSGYLKLASTNHSITFKFDVDLGERPSATATLYQRGYIDSYSGNRNKYIFTGGKQSLGTYSPDCEIRFNGSESIVDLSSYQNQTFYDVFGDPVNSNSSEKDVESGVVTLNNGINEFQYKRVASYNLLISYFVLVIES